MTDEHDSNDREGRDPDPVAAILTQIGAVGAVATIASYVESRGHKSQWRDRREDEDKRGVLAQQLESVRGAVGDLREQQERLQALLKVAAPGLGGADLSGTALRFAAMKPVLGGGDYHSFTDMHLASAHTDARIAESVYGAIAIIDELEMCPGGQALEELIGIQSALNDALAAGSVGAALAGIELAISRADAALGHMLAELR